MIPKGKSQWINRNNNYAPNGKSRAEKCNEQNEKIHKNSTQDLRQQKNPCIWRQNKEIIHLEDRREKIEENKHSPGDSWGQDHMSQHTYNGSPRREGDRESGRKKVEETMAPNSPNSMKNINLPAQETQQTPHLINTQTHQSQTAESNKRKRTCYIHRLAVQLTATSHRNKSSEAAEWQPTGKPSPEPLFENEVKWRHPQINNNRDNC